MTALRQVEQRQVHRWLLDGLLICGYGFLIALSAQFRVHLPFSPVPITAQTLMVLLAGELLGAKRGGLATVIYLLLGSFGWLPFAGGSFLGPTGGYLLGFVAAAYFVGAFTSLGWTKHWWSTLIILLMGNSIIYLFGIPWLSSFVGWRSVWSLGLYPFIVGDLLKLVCAFGICRVLNLQHRID